MSAEWETIINRDVEAQVAVLEAGDSKDNESVALFLDKLDDLMPSGPLCISSADYAT